MMFKELLALNKEQHAASFITPAQSYAYAADVHVSAVAIHEFPKVAALYPVVFIQNQADQFSSVALLGLDEGHNLFVNEQGQWKVSYVPAAIRKYPFTLVQKDDNTDEFVVCVDQASGCLQTETGSPLFNEEGQPAPALEGAIKFLSELREMDVHTRRFCQLIKELGLLVPLNVELRSNAGVRKVSGAFVIDEVALNNLAADKLDELQRQNFLPVIYCHLLSLGQFERLVNLADATLEKKGEPAEPVKATSSENSNHSASKKARKRGR